MTPDYSYENCAVCNHLLPTKPPRGQLNKVGVLKFCGHRADVDCIKQDTLDQKIHCLACEYEESANTTTNFGLRIYRSYQVGAEHSHIISLLCLSTFWLVLIIPSAIEAITSNPEEQRLAGLRDPNYVHVMDRFVQKCIVIITTGLAHSTMNMFYRVFSGRNIGDSKVMKKCMGGVLALFATATYPIQKCLKKCHQRKIKILNEKVD